MSRLLPVAVLLLFASGAEAQGFDTFNQSSLARSAVLPTMAQGAVIASGSTQNSATINWTNESYQGRSSRETLLIDGETLRLAALYRQGFGKGFEWSIEVPLMFTGGGVQDSAIESWHSAFGLGNGNRGLRPQDDYRMRYVRDGVTVLDLQKGDSGLGDVRLGAGWSLSKHWTLRALAQFPTGSKKRLTGGHTGMALWTDATLPLGASGRASITFSAGGSVAEQAGPLAAQQQSAVALGGVLLTVPIYGALDGLVQLNANTKLYEGSSLAPLGRVSQPLMVGLRWPWRTLRFDLAIIEDANVNASPDFGLLLGVRVLAPQ
ncbi:MAG: DUF3187 family protein [Pseudomonadota bacterium]